MNAIQDQEDPGPTPALAVTFCQRGLRDLGGWGDGQQLSSCPNREPD